MVIRAGYTAAQTGTVGAGYRAAAVAMLVRIDGAQAIIRRVRYRLSRTIRWARPVRIPAANVLRDATPREIALGYPVS